MTVRNEDSPLVTLTGSANAVQGEKAVDQTLSAGSPDFAARSDRLSLTIQNVGTTAVAVLVDASDTNGLILQGGSAANDGEGGAIVLDDYVGAVWLYSLDAGGGTVRYIEVRAP